MMGLVKTLGAVFGVVSGARTIMDGLSSINSTLGEIQEKRRADGLSDSSVKAKGFDLGENIQLRIDKISEQVQKGLRDPEQYVRYETTKIVTEKCGKNWCIPEKNWRAEVEAVFNWDRKNIRYVRDIAGIDTYQSAKRTLRSKAADCDCSFILIATQLMSIGFPIKARVMQTKGASSWSHIMALVGLPPGNPTGWLPLDLTMNHPAGWYPPKSIIVKTKDFYI